MELSENPPQLSKCFQNLVWSCLDSDLTRSAVFFGERYFAMFPGSHDARHLYATALLREGQTFPSLTVVDIRREEQCGGCLEIKAKCCTALGRYRQAREALDQSLIEAAKAAPSTWLCVSIFSPLTFLEQLQYQLEQHD